jgi:putative copper resistance protein D
MSLTLPLITRGPPSGLPPLGAATALRVWQFAPVVSAVLVVLAAAYLAGVYRVRRRHPARPWPAGRAAAFLAGLGVIAVATQSSIGAYDDVLFSVHMIHHLLLIMVAPPLLVLGRPVTLLLHSAGNPVHTWVKRAVRSRVASALTWPPAATALYCAVVAGTHLTPLMNLVLENSAVHDAEHALYLLTGYLFFLPVLGSEPIRWRVPPAGRYLMLLLVMPVDTAVGVLLMLAPREWFPAYARTGRASWAGGWKESGRTALLRALDTTGLPAPAASRAGPDTRAIDDDAHLAAYNAYLSALDTGHPAPRQAPW